MNHETKLTVERTINAPASCAYGIVVAVERFPDFMKNVSGVTVIADTSEKKIVEWEMLIDGVPLEWTEEIVYDPDRMRVQFRAVSGIFDRFDGFWEVSSCESGARVRLELVYELGLPEIESVISGVLRKQLTLNLEAMLRSIEARAQASS